MRPSVTADDDPTKLDAPPGVEPPTAMVAPTRSILPGGAATSSGGQFRTVEATLILRHEEALRMRALGRLVIPLVTVAILALFVSHGDRVFRAIAAVSFIATLLCAIAAAIRFRREEGFDARLALGYGVICGLSILVAMPYVGVFSPTVMGAALGIYFFGLSDDELSGWIIFWLLAAGFALLAILGIAGVIPLDRAVVAIEHPDLPGLTALTFACELLLVLTFGLARRSRRATREAFERLERAAMQIRQRDALIDEARADLDAARAARVGRYSDRTVGEYRVGEVIGRGAMGEVYEGRHLPSDRRAALKFLSPLVASEPEYVERFFREANVASTLRSEHIVQMYALGSAEDGAPFIAMELLSGCDLAEILRGRKRLPLFDVVDLVREVSSALAEADRAGIVHRDVKPQNLYWAEAGGRHVWKVLDFGVSKAREATSQLTQGAAIGTPSYMSPEQARGLEVDHRSDVFSLGVIAYRCITGRPAFTAGDSVITLYNVVHVQPARPSEIAEVSPDVERVLAKVLAKDRERRIASAPRFAELLADARDGRLDPKFADEADRLIEEAPWGSELPRR
jgi:eukaryotic-like serine/threonine-protein kinase